MKCKTDTVQEAAAVAHHLVGFTFAASHHFRLASI